MYIWRGGVWEKERGHLRQRLREVLKSWRLKRRRWKMKGERKDRYIGSYSDRVEADGWKKEKWREREKRRTRRRWQSALFKLTEIFTKLRVMRSPLKALFSWAGRQPLVMHKCICDAHTRFKMGQNLEKGWTRTFHCQGAFRYQIDSGCVLVQHLHVNPKVGFFEQKTFVLEQKKWKWPVLNRSHCIVCSAVYVSSFRLNKYWYTERGKFLASYFFKNCGLFYFYLIGQLK